MSHTDTSGSGSELSSRHIPDMDAMSIISNTSFSFQIPATATGNLLADDDEIDFFRNAEGVDVSLALTHASAFSPAETSPACIVARKDVEHPRLHEARSSTPEHIVYPTFSPGLAVDDLKHKLPNQRPKLSLNIKPIIQAVQTSPMTPVPLPHERPRSNDQVESNQTLLESKPTAIQDSLQVPDGPGTITKRTTKKVEIGRAEERQGRKKGPLHTQRKIVEGGIAKSRITTNKKTREVPSGLPQRSAPSLPKRPVLNEDPGAELLLADHSYNSIPSMTGIAGRLVQYGQQYVDAFRWQNDEVPTEKLSVDVDFANAMNEVPSSIKKTTQDKEDSRNSYISPVEGIADSLIQYRKRDPNIYPVQIEKNVPTEKASLDFGFPPETKAASIVQKAIQEQTEETCDDDEIEDDRSKPLTLLHLSPRKQRIQDSVKPPTPMTRSGTDVRAPPPTRPATKRPIAPESTSEEPKLKRSKGDDPKPKERPTKPTVSDGKLNSKPRVPSTRSRPQSRKPSATSSGSGSRSTLKKSDSATAVAPAGIRRTKSRIVSSGKQAAVFNPGTGWNDNVCLSSEKNMQRSNSSLKLSGSGLQNSRIQNERKQDEKPLIPSSSFKAHESKGTQQSTEPTLEDSESRSTSRSHSNSQSHRHKFYHPAPNFKAIHAAFNASIAQRKENIHPTVPLPMRWETESRMQERKKFEDRVREKEKEREKEEDEMRRHREAEEERELKELRKRMVVKAHEVPEWYNARPKTRKRLEQDTEN